MKGRRFRNLFLVAVSLTLTAISHASPKIVLVPLDDRPATGQFAQMIGEIAGLKMVLPPAGTLGRFTQAGDPDAVMEWLESQSLPPGSHVIVSTDMLLYGGLIASRTPDTSLDTARQRIRRFVDWRSRNFGVKVYAFSSLMRLVPTSQVKNNQWRELLRRFVIVRQRFFDQLDLASFITMGALATRLPEQIVLDYDAARTRNFVVQTDLMRHLQSGSFNFMMLGQDDAQQEGPQIAERDRLRLLSDTLSLEDRIFFCEGIDQMANMMVSRVLTDVTDWKPTVKVVYSDPLSAKTIPPYETRPVENSLVEHIAASGALLAGPEDTYDYALYVNTPNPRTAFAERFMQELQLEIEQGLPVAIADINLGKSGTADPVLFDYLTRQGIATNLLAYAGWNTAGNTIGTAIPAANTYLYARRKEVDPLERELMQRRFLLHRLVNDYEYHRFTRPKAYELIDKLGSPRDEVYGEAFRQANNFVQRDMERRLNDLFKSSFAGKRFFAGSQIFEIEDLENVDIELPWPRAYEVRLGFQVKARQVVAASEPVR